MDKYYHFTSYNCFNSIMKNGLIPQTGFRCKSIGDDSYGVFLSKGIDRSILMYSLILSFYEKYTGYEGDRLITDNLMKIKRLIKYKNNKQIEEEIECYNSEIQKVNQIRSCGSFINYLGGLGCFLSTSGLKNVDESVLENCCYNGIIPPSNINVVNIRNKYTNEYINSLNAVLSYFMYLFPIEDILKITQDNNKNGIYKLYKYRNESDTICYNPNNYDLVEIPISYYDNQKIKTLS